jgi:hypothetical protein
MSRLLPDDIASTVPALYSTDNEKDPVVRVKFFTPDSSWTWFMIEYDPEQKLGFGLVDGHERELGYFSLEEMESVKGPLGLPIERDLHWTPKPLSQCGGDARESGT